MWVEFLVRLKQIFLDLQLTNTRTGLFCTPFLPCMVYLMMSMWSAGALLSFHVDYCASGILATVSDVTLADLLLMQFCQRVEQLYGKKAITPNMHMHLYLKDILLDYGPVYGFWLFSYE